MDKFEEFIENCKKIGNLKELDVKPEKLVKVWAIIWWIFCDSPLKALLKHFESPNLKICNNEATKNYLIFLQIPKTTFIFQKNT